MKITKLTISEINDVAPTDCAHAEAAGEIILGGLQIAPPNDEDGWPNAADLHNAAVRRFGASACISSRDIEPDETAVTWLVVEAKNE
jgi:hypothetical protein